MMTGRPQLFFGVGTGRCGTMAVSNALSLEQGVVCLHEGKRRFGERPGPQVLRSLTLENRIAYEDPSRAAGIVARYRGSMSAVATTLGCWCFGDIAYNYAPLLDAIRARYPDARLLVFVRDGYDFVRSAAAVAGEDAAPVGWAPEGKSPSAIEQYISLGRLAPRSGDKLALAWPTLPFMARNAWLWAETNRLIFDAIDTWPEAQRHLIRFEDFFSGLPDSYARLRGFLELPGEPPAATLSALRARINARRSGNMQDWRHWSPDQLETFARIAGPMMRRLGYELRRRTG